MYKPAPAERSLIVNKFYTTVRECQYKAPVKVQITVSICNNDLFCWLYIYATLHIYAEVCQHKALSAGVCRLRVPVNLQSTVIIDVE
jgi:hypothetical protein